MNNLREIAEYHDLQIIETTSQRNGYPTSLTLAIIGFENFEEAKTIASKHDLSIESFTKKEGWNLWYRTGNTMYEAIKNQPSDFNDDYSEYSLMKKEESHAILEMKEAIEDSYSFGELETLIEIHKELWEAYQDAGEDEIIITCNGGYHDTLPKNTMNWENDSIYVSIGLIDRV